MANEEPTIPTARVYTTEPALNAGEDNELAERYIVSEIAEARRNLRLTQIAGGLVTLLTLGYVTYAAGAIGRELEPKRAAETAQGLIVQQVETQGERVAQEFKQRIPALIADLPDQVKTQVPQYRTRLEQQIETDMKRHLEQNTAQLDKMVDEVLAENKDQIRQLLQEGDNPQVVNAIGEDLQTQMLEQVKAASFNGETMQGKLTASLEALQQVENRMAKMAANQNLTPQEQKARRAIGGLTNAIEQARETQGKTNSL